MSPRFPIPDSRTLLCALALFGIARPAAAQELVVFNAGSLARPLRAALDTFATREHIVISQESAGSLETARKLTDLGKVPDIIALADYEVFPQLLMPQHVTWYAQFAMNSMVIAYTPRSKYAKEITVWNWMQILLRHDVQTGRADPDLDPNGYRTLLTLQLAEKWYDSPGLAAQLLAVMPKRNVRPKSADLVALLQAGEFDYIWSYESTAQAASLSYLHLPPQIDLGDPNQSARYPQVSVRVQGRAPGETLTFQGEPIVYGISIPKTAPHAQLAARVLAWLLSPDGVRVMRAAKLEALAAPVIVGTGAPPAIAKLATP
jgi:molybdate/tungstate transport system substrate-binding protein